MTPAQIALTLRIAAMRGDTKAAAMLAQNGERK